MATWVMDATVLRKGASGNIFSRRSVLNPKSENYQKENAHTKDNSTPSRRPSPLGPRYSNMSERCGILRREHPIQVVSRSARVVHLLTLKPGYSVYDALPKQSGLPVMTDAVVVAFLRHVFRLKSQGS